jgi:hypothetical protein
MLDTLTPCYRGMLEAEGATPFRAAAGRRPSAPANPRESGISVKEAVIAVSPGPRLVRWVIAMITAFFVVMMFSPLVQEIIRRIRLTGSVNVP